ncbi:MAG: periplasmic heavy metal sensor [bacterium]|jgi:Spy/CpxP family protein refolding chaperone|nr:periplasmic heavy metal sensor [candidate division KSB1 bacterium]MCU0642949.1 periplasmic heavy metal sensor [bacterium]
MSKKTLGWLLVFSVILNISTVVTFSYFRWVKTNKARSFSHGRDHRDYFNQQLGLTKAQADSMEILRSKFWQEIKPLRMQLDQARQELFEILKQDTLDDQKINVKIDEISEIQKLMQRKTIENFLQHQSILAPEQNKKFIEIMSSRLFFGEPGRGRSEKFREDRYKREKTDTLKLNEERPR